MTDGQLAELIGGAIDDCPALMGDGDGDIALAATRVIAALRSQPEALSALRARIPADDGWHDIATVPVDQEVLMFCPDLGITNRARVEIGVAHSSRGSHHAWATHWRPLPSPPTLEST